MSNSSTAPSVLACILKKLPTSAELNLNYKNGLRAAEKASRLPVMCTNVLARNQSKNHPIVSADFLRVTWSVQNIIFVNKVLERNKIYTRSFSSKLED